MAPILCNRTEPTHTQLRDSILYYLAIGATETTTLVIWAQAKGIDVGLNISPTRDSDTQLFPFRTVWLLYVTAAHDCNRMN